VASKKLRKPFLRNIALRHWVFVAQWPSKIRRYMILKHFTTNTQSESTTS